MFLNYSRHRVAAIFLMGVTANSFALSSSSWIKPVSCTKSFQTSTINDDYNLLAEKLTEIERLNGIKGLLGWDEMVLMKAGSANARGNQKSALTGIIYEKQSSLELKALIDKIFAGDLSTLPSDYERANVRDAERDFTITASKTKEMTTKEAELEGRAYQIWVESRKNNNYAPFAEILSEMILLKGEIASVTHKNLSSYDGNIDSFERGMLSSRLDEIFSSIKPDIVNLIREIAAQEQKKPYILPEPFQGGPLWTIDKQKELCIEIAQAIGFDFDTGRLDVSVHPFTGGSHPNDVRITTRYSETNWLEGIAGTVHEVGHALYEQGRNSKYDDLPVSRALSMGVHESQSLFWERMIFQSREFWIWCTPLVHKHFPHTQSMSAEDFYIYVNQVAPGLIRVEADEVTYPLHIILRYELEKGLFDKTLSISNLNNIWITKMKDMLGVTVPSDAQGVLQDIHWSLGAFGYFPSYTLGAMIASQLFETAEESIPNLRDKISKGEFKELRTWLKTNIHEVGSLYASPDELLVAVTKKPLDPKIFLQYLENKYGKLYDLPQKK
eukprot:gene7569-15522_t